MKISLACGGSSVGIPIPILDKFSAGVIGVNLQIKPNAHLGYQGVVIDTGGGLGVFKFETEEVYLDLSQEEEDNWYSIHGSIVTIAIDASFVYDNNNPINIKISRLLNNEQISLEFNCLCLPDSFSFSEQKIEFTCELLQIEE